MIARHETYTDKTDIWTKLAAPLPSGVVSWRQDGKIVARDGRYFARFVAYIDANTVRERLDGVVPGEWDLTLDLLPSLPGASDEDGNLCSFKARLQILGVIREDVGTGRDYKSAATDAFKRVAVRFGIAHELYAYEQNWVQVDGDSRYARPLEDPPDEQLDRIAEYADSSVRVLHRREGDEMPAVGESDAGVFDLSRDAYERMLPVYRRLEDRIRPPVGLSLIGVLLGLILTRTPFGLMTPLTPTVETCTTARPCSTAHGAPGCGPAREPRRRAATGRPPPPKAPRASGGAGRTWTSWRWR